jgi:glyoxylase-like metal-dependent hydrolase (beta-lactamase superfamily II)
LEIFPGVHRIRTHYGEQKLSLELWLLCAEEVLLIDSGVASTPEEVIFPYLDSQGLRPDVISRLLITHANADHCGGAYAIKKVSPNAVITCHELDAPRVENYQLQLEAVFEPVVEILPGSIHTRSAIRRLVGAGIQVDRKLQGGEWLALSEDWSVQILHTPGHSAGHIIVHDPMHRCAFVGDAVLGEGQDLGDGQLSFPFYTDVENYLSSIETIRELPINYMLSGHFPMMQADAIQKFLDKSASLVREVDRVIQDLLNESPEAYAWETLARQVGSLLGDYPLSVSLLHSVKAHLDRLTDRGKVRTAQIAT